LKVEWTFRELIKLLVLSLIIVPLGIEVLLKEFFKNIFENNLYAGTLIGLVMAIVFTLGVYLIALRPKRLSWKSVGIRFFPKSYWKWIVVWTVINIALSLIILILMDLFYIEMENSKTDSLESNITWFTFSVGFISAAIISPIYEEIFYRGFLYKWFRLKWGIGKGMLLSSFIFTIVHIPTFNTLPVNFIGGVIYAWTYERSGSIIPGIIIHGTFNGIAVIVTALT